MHAHVFSLFLFGYSTITLLLTEITLMSNRLSSFDDSYREICAGMLTGL